jgi:hypothetical protein
VFTDEPIVPRIVWLFSLVLGYSRLIRTRFVLAVPHNGEVNLSAPISTPSL